MAESPWVWRCLCYRWLCYNEPKKSHGMCSFVIGLTSFSLEKQHFWMYFWITWYAWTPTGAHTLVYMHYGLSASASLICALFTLHFKMYTIIPGESHIIFCFPEANFIRHTLLFSFNVCQLPSGFLATLLSPGRFKSWYVWIIVILINHFYPIEHILMKCPHYNKLNSICLVVLTVILNGSSTANWILRIKGKSLLTVIHLIKGTCYMQLNNMCDP